MSIAIYSHAESSAFMTADGIVNNLTEEEYINVVSATSENIKLSYNFKTIKTLRVYNLLGKCVVSTRLASGSGSVDLPATLEKGTYIYSIEEGGKTFGAKKFIVR